MNVDELPEDSDSSDEDYIPGAKPEEVVSEVDSDGEPEDCLSDSEQSPKKKRRKTNKTRTKQLKNQSEPAAEEVPQQKSEVTEEEKKKQADALWADFLQDTNFKPKNSTQTISQNNPSKLKKKDSETPSKPESIKKNEPVKVKITEVFEFAGEEVKIEKEVPVDSAEARLLGETSSSSTSKLKRSSNLSGIGSVLNQLGKKKKISTLEKTKLDWDRFKKDENIEEELNNHNKGKDGYLDKQDFLQRADLRRFEIEKEVRTIERNKRMNLGEPF